MKRMSSSLSLKIKTWITQLRLLNYWHTMPLEHELRVAKNLFTIRMVLNRRQWTKYMHNQGFWHGQMKRAARYFCRRLWQPFLELRRKLWTIGWAIKIIFENVTYSKGTGETQRLICLIRVQDCNSFEHMVSSLAFPAIFTILRLSPRKINFFHTCTYVALQLLVSWAFISCKIAGKQIIHGTAE